MSDNEPATSVLSPYLAVGDATAALEWYREVFGAIETTRYTGDDGRIGHAELVIGGARILLADAYPEAGHYDPRHYGGTPVSLHLEVVDVDYTFARAVKAGADTERAPADQGHGNRNAVFRDPWGHRWMVSQPTTGTHAEPGAGGFAVSGRQPVEPGYLTMRTEDLDRARAFFGALFDWQIEPGSLEGGGHVANTHFPMGLMQGGVGTPVTVYFRVDDIDVYAAKVRDLGGEVLSTNEYPSGGNAECVDNQGFRFDLYQPTAGY